MQKSDFGEEDRRSREGSAAAPGRDLTRGPVFGSLLLFALPMILGTCLQQLYNVVDTWVVGRYVGSGALAAVGASFALMSFLTSVLLGLCMGSGVVFSMRFGQGDEGGLSESICSSFILTAATALALTAGALLLTGPILGWLNIPEDIRGMTRTYLKIVFCGIPAIFIYNFFAAYLKAVGDSVRPLWFLALAACVNIGLDLYFVAVLGLGTGGAALATVIAQYLSGAGICLYVLKTDALLRHAFRSFHLRRENLREITNYSVLTCLQQSVMNLGILMVQGLVNSFGTTVMAAFAAAVKIDAFAYLAVQEYANAFSTFIAQNRGAGEIQRMKKGIRCGTAASFLYCLAASALIWIFAEQLMGIFIRAEETEIIREGVRYLRIEGAFYAGIGCLFLFYGLYRALGKPGMSIVLTVISLGTRVALAYLLSAVPRIGVAGIWWSVPIGWGLADLAGFLYYLWKGRRLLEGVGETRG